MLPTRQGNKVDRTVIVFNAVQVVDYPTRWKRLTASILPYYNVLKHITIFTSSGMTGAHNADIPPSTLGSPTLPVVSVLASRPRRVLPAKVMATYKVANPSIEFVKEIK